MLISAVISILDDFGSLLPARTVTVNFISYSEDVHTSPLKEQNIQTRPNDYILSIKEIVNGVSVDNEEKNYEATQSARKMLSRERNPPIDDVINVSIDR